MRTFVFSLLVLVSACGSDVSVIKQKTDSDGDGYSADVDCDDAHATVNPDAPELCDGLDNDCDGTVDEEVTDGSTFYADNDGDGAGDLDSPTLACELPVGFVDNSDDCDDDEPLAFAGNTELCDGIDNDCDGAVDDDPSDASSWYADTDADDYGDGSASIESCEAVVGYVADSTDCDDGDANVHPDADEVCDDANADEDCDGLADDDDSTATGQSTWFPDRDADTYGDAAESALACDQPADSVATGTDCDDDDASIHPDADEVCDGADNDCDTLVDDEDDSVSGADDWYDDDDSDGYGAGAAWVACTQPSGTVANDDDCDDGSAAVSPADTEICDSANTDEDCDGVADDSDSGVSSSGKSTWYDDDDSDGYGDATDTSSACDLPTGYASNDDDCDDSSAAISPGDAEICDSANTDEDCDGKADDLDSSVSSSGKATWYDDDDSDGYGDASDTSSACDLPTGYATNDDDCNDSDAAVSPADAEICDSANTDEDCDGYADDSDSSVSSSGKSTWYDDDDGDGYGDASDTSSACDLPTGSVADSTDCDDSDAGVSPADAEVCDNDIDDDCDDAIDESCGLSGTFSADDADVLIYGESKSDQFGASLSGGFDFDEDGIEDLVVGAPSDDDGSAAAGALYLYTGDVTAGSSLATDDDYFKLYGTTFYGDAGRRVWAIPDLDRDGDDEIITIGDGTATMNLLLGPSSKGTATLSSAATATYTSCDTVAFAGHSNALTGDDDWMCAWSYDSSSTGKVTVYSGKSTVVGTLAGESSEDSAGYALAGGEDVDGDGYDDYAVGAYGDDDAGTDAGATYLVFAPVSSSATTSLADADSKILGNAAGDFLGSSLQLDDMDSDGYGDAWVGAVGNDENGSLAGAVYLFDAPSTSTVAASTASAVVYGAAANDELGHGTISFISTGDSDADGTLDLLLGASLNDEVGATAGQAWLLYGPVVGTVDLASSDSYDAAFQGATASDAFGQSGTMASDLNDDGRDDIIIGAPYGDGGSTTNTGAVYVFYGE